MMHRSDFDTEHHLKSKEAQLALIYDTIADVIFILSVADNDRFVFSFVNKRFLDVTGLSEDAVIGKDVKDVIPEPAHALVFEKYREAIRSGKPVSWEEISVYPSGEKIGEVTVTPVIVPGRPCRELIGTVHDITEHRKMHALLEKSEERWRLALEGSGVGVWDWKMASAEVSFSPYWKTLLGYGEHEIAGEYGEWENRIHPEDKAGILDAIAGAVKVHKPTIQNEYRLLHKSGQWIWVQTHVLINYNRTGMPERMIGTIVDVSAQREAEALQKKSDEVIWRQANFDTLTALPNRNQFSERLQHQITRAQQQGITAPLLLIDLDRFKEVNDGLGHSAGDQLLIEAAHRLRHCVRGNDMVARLGGDEFAVVLAEATDQAVIDQTAQRMLDALSRPFNIDGNVAYLSASIGSARYPVDATDIETLIKYADQAMYSAKSQGGNRHSHFLTSMQERLIARRKMVNDLHAALPARQFQVYFQPILGLASQAALKAEALVRWFHPEHGFISPAEFIPVAEEIGMIEKIGDWVFDNALRQCASLCQRESFELSINVSPAQFRGAGKSLEALLEAIDRYHIPPQSVVVEITEGVLLALDDRMERQFARLADIGIRFSLDDFGTGYSSLSYITRLKFDYLKIDRLFVQNLEASRTNLALCETMITMAHKLGMTVIAEGIETPGQCRILQDAGCDFGQGYLFAKPMPFSDFEGFIRAG